MLRLESLPTPALQKASLQSPSVRNTVRKRLKRGRRAPLTCCTLSSSSPHKMDRGRESAPAELLLQRETSGPIWTGDHQEGDVLHGRYEVQERLGEGANGVTYKALDRETGGVVAVKALSLRKLRDWKQLQLFEREAQTLQALHHASIPQYLDYFEEDSARDKGFYLVQELAAGKSLAEMVRSGWRGDDAEIMRIAVELLKVLQYLGERRPAVVHRDIKPENIILEEGKSGGRVFMVDFGGVQAAAAEELAAGSTVVGTWGFMAPEQFMGAAVPASDLFGLGGTLLLLLTGKPPSAFPQERMRLNFAASLPESTDPRLRVTLQGLLEPVLEDRLSAAAALATLRGEKAPLARTPPQGRFVSRKGWRARVNQGEDRLVVEIPPLGLLGNLGQASFALVWNGTVASWTLGALSIGSPFAAAFSIPFWVAGFKVSRDALRTAFSSERLVITRDSWRLERTRRGRGEDSSQDRVEVEEQGRTADFIELGQGGSTGALQLLSYTGCGEEETAALQAAILQRIQKLAADHTLPVDIPTMLNEQRRLRRAERDSQELALKRTDSIDGHFSRW